MTRVEEIKERLAAVQDGHPWKFDPNHEMFVGSTNAINMRDRVIDLGRTDKSYIPYQDELTKGYRLTESSQKKNQTTNALGEFLCQCREDMQYLVETVERLADAFANQERKSAA